MNKKRSICLTCVKQNGSKELLSLAEALTHSQNFVDHHLIINPDAEEKVQEDFNGA